MPNYVELARAALQLGQRFLPELRGGGEALDVAQAVVGLTRSVTRFADPPTKAALEAFEREVFAGLDDTIDRLGDDPPRR